MMKMIKLFVLFAQAVAAAPIVHSQGCFALGEYKERFLNYVRPRGRLVPERCYQECVERKANPAFLVTMGDYCVCVDNVDMARFLPGKTPGVCQAPCGGDRALYCGGRNSYDVYVVRSHEL